MNIYIFDDTKQDLESTTAIVKSYFSDKNFACNIEVFDKIKSVDEFIKIINDADLVLLDIELADYNGIDLAKEIGKHNKDIKLIFVSNHDKYLIDGYKVNADRYFLKPILQDEFNIEMDAVIQKYISYNKCLYDLSISKKKIYFRNILYVERLNRKSIIYTLDGNIECNHSLKELYNISIEGDFIYSHRAFIVNLQNVSAYNNHDITLINGRTIPLSRNMKEEFETNYLKYLNKRM